MYNNYTQQANDRCFDLADARLYQIWETLENTPEDTSAEKWRKKILAIAQEYRFSSRFALMRILYNRCQPSKGTDVVSPDEGVSFGFVTKAGPVRFEDVSIGHAQTLSQQELEQYKSVLLEIAASQQYLDFDASAAKALIAKGMDQDKQPLTREDAFALGHVLGFSLSEMQWFLLRVFDAEDGFMYRSSNDLIEAYCFLSSGSARDAAELKRAYEELSADVEKVDAASVSADWTQRLQLSFVQLVQNWMLHPDDRDERFLDWIVSRAPELDVPSKTALRVFRNIAAYAYCISEGEEPAPDEHQVFRCLQEIADGEEEDEYVQSLLYRDGKISKELCEALANVLYLENSLLSFTDAKDKYKTKAWSTLNVNQGEKPVRHPRQLAELLSGERSPQKADLLYLLWFMVNRTWTGYASVESDGTPSDQLSPDVIFNRIADFIETAEYCLDKALLPNFYPPHLLEQSMLLAIVSSRDTAQSSPAETYEALCSSLTMPRKKKAGSKKHGKEAKLEAVQYYLAHEGDGLKACAEKFGISFQTLSAWKNKYLKEKGSSS